jgi:polyisoprenoid-binding protein YceI
MHIRNLTLALFVAGSLSIVACKDPSEGKAQATVAEAKSVAPNAASAAPAAKSEALAFDEKTATLGFVGSKVTGSHEGKFDKLTGTVTLVDGKAVGSSVKVSIDDKSLSIEPDMLKKHLSGPDFFDVEKFPTSSFESTDVKSTGGDKYEVTGNLDLHGAKKSITFPATITVDAQNVAVAAEFNINRKDFGIVYAGKANDLIRDNVTIKLNIKAPRKG